jgi:hypothetical protein
VRPDAKVPPLKVVQAALRNTTEWLASELADPTLVRPNWWSDFEWHAARAVAVMHGISALLVTKLRWEGPDSWQAFLTEQRAHIEERHVRIEELLQVLDSRTCAGGIPVVALKGAALYSLGLYHAGERPMADIDLLVKDHDVAALGKILEKHGFQKKFAIARHEVFEPVDGEPPAPFGEHSANPIKIEVHCCIGENLPLRTVDVSSRIFPKVPRPGLNAYPSKAALMTHLLLHAAGSMTARAVRLINLHDIAKLSGCMTDGDWEQFLQQDGPLGETLWWAFPPLALTSSYYGCVPDNVLSAAAASCQWVLRAASRRNKLSDVSLSHMWIPAFPGIEWSRSPREALVYAARRVMPSAAARALRPMLAVMQPEAKHLQLADSGSSWTNLSQSRRILRWLTSRPPRPESLAPVRGALAQWN